MKRNDNFWKQVLKRFYGLEELDEYHEQELNRQGHRILIVIFFMLLLANPIFFLLYIIDKSLAATIMLAVNIIIFSCGLPWLLVHKVRKKKLDLIELEEKSLESLKNRHLRQLQYISFALGCLFTFSFLVGFLLAKPNLNLGILGWTGVVSLMLLISSVVALLCYLGMKRTFLKRIALVSDQD